MLMSVVFLCIYPICRVARVLFAYTLVMVCKYNSRACVCVCARAAFARPAPIRKHHRFNLLINYGSPRNSPEQWWGGEKTCRYVYTRVSRHFSFSLSLVLSHSRRHLPHTSFARNETTARAAQHITERTICYYLFALHSFRFFWS